MAKIQEEYGVERSFGSATPKVGLSYIREREKGLKSFHASVDNSEKNGTFAFFVASLAERGESEPDFTAIFDVSVLDLRMSKRGRRRSSRRRKSSSSSKRE
ncbi:hypothetical protein AMECASPLE_033700 [Ameca splendens]|uniref:Uncharacterized protein n=1 Tax=Ameca splendens TaxID=208324 RepID=A0ABV0YJ23_9TELE